MHRADRLRQAQRCRLPRGGFGLQDVASTVQTVGTKNEQPVGKKQKTGISRLSEIEEYCRDAAEDLGAEWFCGQTAARCVQDADGAVKASSPRTPTVTT